MAKNLVYLGTPAKNRERALSTVTVPTTAPTSIDTGVPVVFPDGPAVSLTASGGSTKSFTTPQGYTLSGVPNGGVGNAQGAATFAFDGTYEFAVTGATTSTASGARVYITTTGGLTLTEGTNTAYGYTDYPPGYAKTAGRAPVKIEG